MLVELEVLNVALYEGGYQFKVKQVIKPNNEARLFDDISRELDNQMNYRATNKSLWAIITDELGNEQHRVVRISNGLLQVKNYGFDYKYMSLSRAELVEVV